jgi:hypothetical protein
LLNINLSQQFIESPNAVRVIDVESHGQGIATRRGNRSHNLGQRTLSARGEDYTRTCTRQHLPEMCAKPTRGPCNQRRFPDKI